MKALGRPGCAWVKRSSLLTLLAVGALPLGATTPPQGQAAAVPAAPAQVLWITAPATGQKEVYFVPSGTLAKIDWSNPQTANLSPLGLNATQEASLRSALAEKIKWGGAWNGCHGDVAGEGYQPSAPASMTLAQVVQQTGVAFVGRVLAAQAGFVPNMTAPATLVTVQVEEVLNDPEKQLGGLAQVTFLDYHGDVSLGAVRLCNVAASGNPVLQKGNELLVGGYKDPSNGANVNLGWYGQVTAGQVSLTHKALKEPSPVALDKLRQDLRALPPAQPRKDLVPTVQPPAHAPVSGTEG
jgi:hypothetical protein